MLFTIKIRHRMLQLETLYLNVAKYVELYCIWLFLLKVNRVINSTISFYLSR